MFSTLHLPLVRMRAEQVETRARRLGPLLASIDAGPRVAVQAAVTVRQATPDDARELLRLAELDSAQPLRAPVLIGEREGVAVAALSLRDDAVVANPFVPTLDVIALLRVRARQLRREGGRRRSGLRVGALRRAAS